MRSWCFRLDAAPRVLAVLVAGALLVATGCGGQSSGPVELIPTDPAVIASCADALMTTYCALGDATAAATRCTASLSSDVRAKCDPMLGCVTPYSPTRSGACMAGPTYAWPSQCASPVDDNCAFYRSCLEAAHPCGVTGYALGFGEPLCYLFIAHRDDFTPAGQKWLSGVRTCLQRSLAPLVTAAIASCDALADQAIASHTTCYTDAQNSFCDLAPADVNALTALLLPYLKDPRVNAQVMNVLAFCQHR